MNESLAVDTAAQILMAGPVDAEIKQGLRDMLPAASNVVQLMINEKLN